MISLTLFHGTSISRATEIEVSGFQFRKGRTLSFGDGIYFYRNFQRAQDFAEQEYKTGSCVIEVEVLVPSEKIRTFSFPELENFPSHFNKCAFEENLYVIDASRDDGIYIVRPEALHVIRIIRRHA